MATSLAALLTAVVGGLICYLCLRPRHTYPLPPSPKPSCIPFIGNHFQLVAPGTMFWKKLDRWAHEYGEIYCLRSFGTTTVVLNSYKAAREILDVRGANFNDRPPNPFVDEFICQGGHIGFTPANDMWRKQRKALAREIAPGTVKQFARVQERDAYLLVDSFLKRPNEASTSIKRFTGAMALGVLYDYPAKLFNDEIALEFKDINEKKTIMCNPGESYYNVLPSWLRWMPEVLMPSKKKGRQIREQSDALDRKMSQWVRERLDKHEETYSFHSRLLQAADEGRNELNQYYTDTLTGSIMGGAATTTTSGLLTAILAYLAFPEVQVKMQQHVDAVVGRDRMPNADDIPSLHYVRATALEVMRWRTAARIGVPHCASKDEIYDGYLIPKGATIISNQWTISHDPAYFPDWDVVRPERYLTAEGEFDRTVPVTQFGFGRRACPGEPLAIRSLILALSCMAWALTFDKARDADGKAIEPNMDPEHVEDSAFVFPPLPFPYAVTIRSSDIEHIVDHTIAEYSHAPDVVSEG